MCCPGKLMTLRPRLFSQTDTTARGESVYTSMGCTELCFVVISESYTLSCIPLAGDFLLSFDIM